MAFDWTSGSQAWNWQGSQGTAIDLVAATNGGGLVVRSTAQGLDSIIRFDPSGNAAPDAWPTTAAANAGGSGLAAASFVASGAFTANPSGTQETAMFDSGDPVDFSTNSDSQQKKKNADFEEIHLSMHVYQVQGTTVNSNGSIATQLQAAQKYWGQKIPELKLDWDGNINSTPVCTASGDSCTTFPEAHLDTYYEPSNCAPNVGWNALTIRFPNAPAPDNKGMNVLFTNSIIFDPPLLFTNNPIESVPLYSFTGCSQQHLKPGNDIVMSNQAFGSVLTHAVGHVFQLDDVSGNQAAPPATGQPGWIKPYVLERRYVLS